MGNHSKCYHCGELDEYCACVAAHPVAGSPVEADAELRGKLARAIEWSNEFGDGNVATSVLLGALVSTGRKVTPAAAEPMPASEAQDGETKPCPFCGSADISDGEVMSATDIAGEAVVQSMCEGCGAMGPGAALQKDEVDYGDTKSIAAWNRRAAPVPASEAASIDTIEFWSLIAEHHRGYQYGPAPRLEAAKEAIVEHVHEFASRLAAPAAPTDAKLGSLLMELRGQVKDMQEAAYTYGEYSQDAVRIALDGVLNAIDGLNPAAQSVRDAAQPTTAEEVRDALTQAENACLAHRIEHTVGDLNYLELAHNTAVGKCCDAIRAIASTTTTGLATDEP